MFAAEEGSIEIDGMHFSPVLKGDLLHIRNQHHPCGIDEDVDLSELGNTLRDDGLDLGIREARRGNAIVLHDDVVDDSSLRRGIESANAVWGNQASVLVGDFLFSRAFQIMVEDGSLQVLKILSTASAVIAEGEVQQLANSNDLHTTEQNCLEVVTAKTAKLFAAACEIGAVVANKPAKAAQSLANFGLNFGISFQLIDDVIDYAASDSVIGKQVGDDFREGKVTLAVLLAYDRGSKHDRSFWKRTIEKGKLREGDLAYATGSVSYTHLRAHETDS